MVLPTSAVVRLGSAEVETARLLGVTMLPIFARCNVGYGFINFRTSAACDEFIAKPGPGVREHPSSSFDTLGWQNALRSLQHRGTMVSMFASAFLGQVLGHTASECGASQC